jgi:O-antigen/teichoic acid export membrane protein
MPEIFKLSDSRQLWNFFKKFLLMTVAVTLCLLPLYFLAPFLVKVIYGAAYLRAATVFQVLVLAFMGMVVISVFEMIIYALNRPDLFALLMFLSLLLSLAGNFWLIPHLGAGGAALTLLGLKIFGIIYLFFVIFWLFRSRSVFVRPVEEPVLITEEETAREF